MKILILYENEDSVKKEDFIHKLYKPLEGKDKYEVDMLRVRLKDETEESINEKIDLITNHLSSKCNSPFDLIIGPETSSLVERIVQENINQEIPLLTINATSTNLVKLEREFPLYFRLGITNAARVKLILEKIKYLYSKDHRNIYIFSKLEEEYTKDENCEEQNIKINTYSKNLKDEVIRQLITDDKDAFKEYIFHNIFFRTHFEELNLIEYDSQPKKVVTHIEIFNDIPINPRYPIIICAESLETVALVKHLRDRGNTNRIFAFGNSQKMLRRVMRKSYLVTDAKKSEIHDDKRWENLAESLLFHLENDQEENNFNLETFKNIYYQANNSYTTNNDIKQTEEDTKSLALRGIEKNGKELDFVRFKEQDKIRLYMYSLKLKIEQNQKILMILGAFTSIAVAIAIALFSFQPSDNTLIIEELKTEIVKSNESIVRLNKTLDELERKIDTTIKLIPKEKAILKNENIEENQNTFGN